MRALELIPALILAGTLVPVAWGGDAYASEPEPRARIALQTAPKVHPGDILKGQPVEVESGYFRKGVWTLVTTQALSPPALVALIQDLGELPGVLIAEEDLRVVSNEVDGCSIQPGEVSPQQCTIAEVDGTPTHPEYKKQSAISQIGALIAQRVPHPYTPVVAVIDTGLDLSHPVFHGRLKSAGYDFVEDEPRAWEKPDGHDDDGDGLIDEAVGHGTHIAGTVALVNPWCKILPVRCLDDEGNGTASWVAAGIHYAVEAGADVINLSVSLSAPSKVLAVALKTAEARGVLIFTSSGNTGGEVLFPGDYNANDFRDPVPGHEDFPFTGDNVITVAAVDSRDIKAGFSAFGPEVDVSAPGVDVYGPMPGGQFAWWSGTSMATAVASGVASLVIGVAGPDGKAAQQLVLQAADSIDEANPDFEGHLGSGRVDATEAAIEAFQD